MGKKKLWIVSELFLPEETSTAYIMGEIAKIFSSKYDVNVICGSEVYDKSRLHTSSDISDIKKFPFRIYRATSRSYNKNSLLGKAASFVSTTLSLYKLASKLIANNDKVLMVTNPAPLIVLMGRLRTKRGFELNVLVHDVFPENIKAANISLPFFGILKSIFDNAFSKADKLIVIGRDMADILNQKTKKRVPIEIIENWGDFNGIRPIKMPETDRVILEYAGNIGRVQGLEEVIKQLPDTIDLHIYGSGALENELKKTSKSNIFFHGPYRRNEQEAVLGACHISLVTLNDHMYGLGTPSKAYNILASGRPILYFGPKNSEIELLIKENNIGYCGWPKKWDLDKLKQMGDNARNLGEKLYTKEIILGKFLESI